MQNDPIEILKAKLSSYDKWFVNLQQMNEAVPAVQESRDTTQWATDVLNNRPSGSERIATNDLTATLQLDCDTTSKCLMTYPPAPSLESLNLMTSISSTGVAEVYSYAVNHMSLGTAEASTFVDTYRDSYARLRTIQERPARVRDQLSKLGQNVDRFDRANAAHAAAKAGTGERTAAAMEMRTLLDGIKGTLLERARKFPKEIITWDEMGRRLACDGPDGAGCQAIIKEGETRSSLIDELSTIGKDRQGDAAINLADVWTRLIDHIYSVIGLVTAA